MPPALDFDYHIHTIYSGHSGPDMFIPAIMARCSELGLRRAVILEHVPPMLPAVYRSVDDWLEARNDRLAIEAILAEMLPQRSRWSGVEFLVGAEVDADPDLLDGSLTLKDLSGVDVTLASTHILPGGREFWFPGPEIPDEEKPELRERWLAWMANVAGNPLVDVISHPCAELHNCGLADGFGPEFRAAFEPVLAAMAAGRTAFDLNERALERFDGAERLNYAELVARAREMGVRFTVGSDAHNAKCIGKFRLAARVAERAGLSESDFWHPEPKASRS